MQLTEIIATIEKVAAPSTQATWDCSGMQVAARVRKWNSLPSVSTPRPASVAAALDKGAHFLLSHHPLLLKPRLPRRL